jgi:hypothetical protein
MLNLSDITSTICTICRHVNVDLQTMLHTLYIGLFMMYLHIKFHLPRSSGSLLITIRMNAKTTQQRLYFHAYQDPKACSTSVASTLQIHTLKVGTLTACAYIISFLMKEKWAKNQFLELYII